MRRFPESCNLKRQVSFVGCSNLQASRFTNYSKISRYTVFHYLIATEKATFFFVYNSCKSYRAFQIIGCFSIYSVHSNHHGSKRPFHICYASAIHPVSLYLASERVKRPAFSCWNNIHMPVEDYISSIGVSTSDKNVWPVRSNLKLCDKIAASLFKP